MLLLDAGALIAIERGRYKIARKTKSDWHAEQLPRTHGGIVGQVWRDGRRQASLVRWLRGFEIVALDDVLGRRAGELLARAGTSDVIDAALVALARDGDRIVTSDHDDLSRLIDASGREIGLTVV